MAQDRFAGQSVNDLAHCNGSEAAITLSKWCKPRCAQELLSWGFLSLYEAGEGVDCLKDQGGAKGDC